MIQREHKTIKQYITSLKDKIISDKLIQNNKIFEILRKHQVFYYNDDKKNVPFEKFINLGYFVIEKVEGYSEALKESYSHDITLITPEGEKWLTDKLIEFNYIQYIKER